MPSYAEVLTHAATHLLPEPAAAPAARGSPARRQQGRRLGRRMSLRPGQHGMRAEVGLQGHHAASGAQWGPAPGALAVQLTCICVILPPQHLRLGAAGGGGRSSSLLPRRRWPWRRPGTTTDQGQRKKRQQRPPAHNLSGTEMDGACARRGRPNHCSWELHFQSSDPPCRRSAPIHQESAGMPGHAAQEQAMGHSTMRSPKAGQLHTPRCHTQP